MGILFVLTLMTCFCLFIGFIRNYQQGDGDVIPHWYLFVHSLEILLYVIYFAVKRHIRFSRECGAILFFLLHDIFLIALMLLIASVETYLYISLTLLYYIVFFGIIIMKKKEKVSNEPLQRCELPRKTFIEMTEIYNNNTNTN